MHRFAPHRIRDTRNRLSDCIPIAPAQSIHTPLFPRLLQFGHFTHYTYGVLAAIGLIVGLTLIVRLAKRDGIDEDKTWNLGIICIVAGVIGAISVLVWLAMSSCTNRA